jgi:hypothetical protein
MWARGVRRRQDIEHHVTKCPSLSPGTPTSCHTSPSLQHTLVTYAMMHVRMRMEAKPLAGRT